MLRSQTVVPKILVDFRKLASIICALIINSTCQNKSYSLMWTERSEEKISALE